MDLSVLDGKEEQREQVSSGARTRAAKTLSEATECGHLAGVGGSGSLRSWPASWEICCDSVGNDLRWYPRRS